MAISIEVFRNIPIGRGCLMLTKNVLDYVSDKQGDFDIKFISFPSKVAKERGIASAPSIMINRKVITLGVASIEEIGRLIEQAKPITLGIILTKSPHESEDALLAMSVANDALGMGDSADIFLIGDGVWTAKNDLKGEIGDMVNKFVESGGRLVVSSPHLKAGGISQDRILKNTEFTGKTYDTLVDLIMTKWDKVITF